MSDRKRCNAETRYGWITAPGRCQNAPIRGFDHCRHHLTPNERAKRFALNTGITAEQAIERLKALGRADD